MSRGQKLEPHDWLLPLFLRTICIGVKHCCLLTFPFMLFVFKTWSCAAISISSVSFFNNLVFSQFQFSWLLTSSVFLINWMLWLFHEVLPSFQRLSFLVFPSPRRLPLVVGLLCTGQPQTGAQFTELIKKFNFLLQWKSGFI